VARRAIGEWINTTVLGKFMVMSQVWSADAYAEHAGYVPAFGTEVMALLDPRPGERILDLGCGDGVLSAQIAGAGARFMRC
jgi:methylase of polypeptide subunit release factors